MGSAYDCYTRVPYGSLIATVMCIVGVAVFCSQMYNGVSYTLQMFNEVFQLKLYWMDTLRTVFITAGVCMAVVAITLLIIGIGSTGVTRDQVFNGSQAKIGGRISIAICMAVTYILNLAWMGILAFLLLVTFVYILYSKVCDYAPIESPDIGRCIPFRHFGFLFPNTSYPNTLGYHDMNKFSKCGNDFIRLCESVKNTQGIYLAATISAGVVVLSLVHYLICLAANYVHVKESLKKKELEYFQSLQDGELEMLTKARFNA
ncbi:neuronal membrane glycoprotein M6-a-like [Paramacrobiotus metropolitanus]|uniref:neuronal membrane glycoprotein M6-a-like n=1 Tax=Paramacrobiotus metropolitanus TaxID=2943436 RepID=UPI002445EFDA|nr:neuronal membrane glycoprotein M6-a-like [Paramacrobiotus metropolitanus]XP_055340056.1 neuronal membrane glycoprotein M6-a-like [Paramacrobiotus metropolitanus]